MQVDTKQIPDLYKQWCKETKRNGSVLVQGSIQEFFSWLSLLSQQVADDWVSVEERLPHVEDGCAERGYVMVYLRKDRQWGWPTKVGFSKWNRVTPQQHTHWKHSPQPPKAQQLKNIQP